jgi:nucleotide sugar dehydrogenase
MKEVMSPTASETAKIMENSYRALNIAFIDEWSKYADLVEIDLFDVISSIKVRPTHSNIMNPGLGVGGYCLTKDPLMGMVSLDQIFKKKSEFPLSKLSVEINKQMPKNTLKKIMENLPKNGNRILVLGITYREDVADTRFSASEQLISLLLDNDLKVDCYDPMIKESNLNGVNLLDKLPKANNYSVIVLTVKHKKFLDLNFDDWLLNFSGSVIDSNNVMDIKEIKKLRGLGINVKAIGRGNI